MAILRPFRAVRPAPGKAEHVVSVPYDVLDEDEARDLAQGKPYSFLRVIRPEIDLPETVGTHHELVYELGARNLRRYVESEYAVCDGDEGLFIYQIQQDGHRQTGLFGCVSVEDYDRGVIVPHEKTRSKKEEDRMRHMLAQRAHAEPVMLAYRDHKEVTGLVEDATAGEPLYDLTTADGVRHVIWRLHKAEEMEQLFREVGRLYVADGHHRCKAASRAARALSTSNGAGETNVSRYFPAAIFPVSAMRVLPYNRIVLSLPGSPGDFLNALGRRVYLERNVAYSTPPEKGKVCMYLDGAWHLVTLPSTERDTVADELDVARLNEYVFEPLLGIEDPRTDPNLDFVGGNRGPEALKRMVDSGRAAAAFSMYPTSIDDLVRVSDAGLLMPPKSTWFEPKLCSGLLVHLFDECS